MANTGDEGFSLGVGGLPVDPRAFAGGGTGSAGGSDGGGGGRDGEALRPETVEERAGKCPVVMLGHDRGTYFFLTPDGQLREVRDGQLDARRMRSIFGAQIDWLWNAWPVMAGRGDKEIAIGWHTDRAAEWIIKRAHAAGMFDPEKKVRGTGVWRGEVRNGRQTLVIHCGDAVLIEGEWYGAGIMHNGYIYPAFPAETRPSPKPATPADMVELLGLYESWRWRSPAHAPRLLLGFTGCGVIAGALQWRPHIQVTGGPGTGKSTLDDLCKRQFGSIMLGVSAPTEAGIRQLLKGSARPVMVDEMEPDNMERAKRVIELARLGSTDSQSPVPRGSADGRATQWPVRACFMFSAILHPKFKPQDLTRICLLELDPLPTEIRDDGLLPQQWAQQQIELLGEMGAGLRRRMIDGFERFEKNLHQYELAISKLGARARVAKQLGTLLAAADTLLYDNPIEAAHADKYVADFAVPDLTGHEDDEDQADCMARLLTALVSLHTFEGNRQSTVAELVLKRQAGDYHDCLRDNGMAVVEVAERIVQGEIRPAFRGLAVANKHRGLEKIFADTAWQEGGWSQALRRVRGAERSESVISFGGFKSRAVLIPLASLPLELIEEAAGNGTK